MVKKIKKKCKKCGCEMEIYPSVATTKKFCSEACYWGWVRSRNANKVWKRCEQCGRKMKVYRSLLEKRKYCSKVCCGIARRADKDGFRTCKSCGVAKPVTDFPPLGERFYSYCHACHRKKCAATTRIPHDRWVRAKYAAEKVKEVEWVISEKEFLDLIGQQCHYCGGPLNETGIGLDRKEPDLGYVLGNVVPCCRRCNIVKNDHFTYEEMLLLSPTLRLIRDRKNNSTKTEL